MVVELAEFCPGMTPEQQLAAVQDAVRQQRPLGTDLDTMKVSDLWANAGEDPGARRRRQRRHRGGRMQVLKPAGWNSAIST